MQSITCIINVPFRLCTLMQPIWAFDRTFYTNQLLASDCL